MQLISDTLFPYSLRGEFGILSIFEFRFTVDELNWIYDTDIYT